MGTGSEQLDDKILFEIVDQVARITINNPDKGNAMSPAMRDRMTELFESLNGQFEARAIILTATGEKLFCPLPISKWWALVQNNSDNLNLKSRRAVNTEHSGPDLTNRILLGKCGG